MNDMTLVAGFAGQNETYYNDYYSNNPYDYYYDYNYNNYNYPYNYDYNYNNYNTLTSYTTTTDVFSVPWKTYGTSFIQVSHTLKAPSNITSNYKQIRIKSIIYVQPINTQTLANAYINNFNNTFIYTKTGGEIYTSNPNFYSTVYNAYFSYDNTYKTRSDAINNGFSVTWTSSNVSSHCYQPYSGTLANGNSVSNVCGYGINYRVVWEYVI